MTHTISHFDVADNGQPMQLTVKPNGHFVTLHLIAGKTNFTESARIAPKQARRIADALRVAAREAEANGSPVIEGRGEQP